MNQIKPNSQTSKRLRQHPTDAEMTTPRLAYIRANIKEFSVFAVMAVLCWFVVRAFIYSVWGA